MYHISSTNIMRAYEILMSGQSENFVGVDVYIATSLKKKRCLNMEHQDQA